MRAGLPCWSVISHESRIALLVGDQLKFEGKRDDVSVPGTDGHLHERGDLSGCQFLLHALREAVGLFPVNAQCRQLLVGQPFRMIDVVHFRIV